jgi:hypothetical protein
MMNCKSAGGQDFDEFGNQLIIDDSQLECYVRQKWEKRAFEEVETTTSVILLREIGFTLTSIFLIFI